MRDRLDVTVGREPQGRHARQRLLRRRHARLVGARHLGPRVSGQDRLDRRRRRSSSSMRAAPRPARSAPGSPSLDGFAKGDYVLMGCSIPAGQLVLLRHLDGDTGGSSGATGATGATGPTTSTQRRSDDQGNRHRRRQRLDHGAQQRARRPDVHDRRRLTEHRGLSGRRSGGHGLQSRRARDHRQAGLRQRRTGDSPAADVRRRPTTTTSSPTPSVDQTTKGTITALDGRVDHDAQQRARRPDVLDQATARRALRLPGRRSRRHGLQGRRARRHREARPEV